jgi:hypothetical protein
MTLARPAEVRNSAMFPLGCILLNQPSFTLMTYAVPIMMLAPPADGAGRALPLPAAAAGVGPLMAAALRETGAERSLTLMGRWSSLTSVKNLA